MTNAYVRIQREDKWQNVEIEYLTDEERAELFKDASNEELLRWVNFMCNQYECLLLEVINKFGGSDKILFDEKEEMNE
jgi:hypothetical protein